VRDAAYVAAAAKWPIDTIDRKADNVDELPQLWLPIRHICHDAVTLPRLNRVTRDGQNAVSTRPHSKPSKALVSLPC